MARRRAVAAAAPTRFPFEFISRLIRGLLILAAVILLILGGVSGFLTYRVVTTHDTTEVVTPSTYLLTSYESLNFTDRAGGEHEGWLLLGLKGAPVIILSHGYDSNRSAMLSLGTILRENHFNVYVFNFYGPKTREGTSSLGVRQAEDLNAAIETLTKRPSVNAHRVGLFGANMGGYASLLAAEQNPMVRALAVDTVYDSPDLMFQNEFDKLLGGSSPYFRLLATAEFHLFSWGVKPVHLRANLSKLEGVPKLFVSGHDVPELAKSTEELYEAAPQPKRLLVLEHSQVGVASGAEKKEYESQILTFFLENLPLRAD